MKYVVCWCCFKRFDFWDLNVLVTLVNTWWAGFSRDVLTVPPEREEAPSLPQFAPRRTKRGDTVLAAAPPREPRLVTPSSTALEAGTLKPPKAPHWSAQRSYFLVHTILHFVRPLRDNGVSSMIEYFKTASEKFVQPAKLWPSKAKS